MKTGFALRLAACLIAAAPAYAAPDTADADADAEHMVVMPAGTPRPSADPAAEGHVVGDVIKEAVFAPIENQRPGASRVAFAPGSRTDWHSHTAGQTLIVISGTGWVQERGGPRLTVHPGDAVWTPPGVEHWHGAASDSGMVMMGLQHPANGEFATWREPVSQADYLQGKP